MKWHETSWKQYKKEGSKSSDRSADTTQVNSKYCTWKRYSDLRMVEGVPETAEQHLPQRKMAKYSLMGFGLGLVSGMWGSICLLQQIEMGIAHSAVGKPPPWEPTGQRVLWSAQLHRKNQNDLRLKRENKVWAQAQSPWDQAEGISFAEEGSWLLDAGTCLNTCSVKAANIYMLT